MEHLSPSPDHEPFGIEVKPGLISLSGDLDGSPQVREKLRSALSEIGGQINIGGSQIIIDASQARIVPDGVAAFTDVIQNCLQDSQLTYEDSQLACILKYDDQYDHPHSKFTEHGDDVDSL